MVGRAGPVRPTWPVDATEGADVVVVAGGIGLAPLRPASYRLSPAASASARIALLYGGRTPEHLLYPEPGGAACGRGDVTVDAAAASGAGGWASCRS